MEKKKEKKKKKKKTNVKKRRNTIGEKSGILSTSPTKYPKMLLLALQSTTSRSYSIGTAKAPSIAIKIAALTA